MKKLTYTIIVALGLFLVACSPTPEYNFSTLKDLEASIVTQAEKEGLSAAKAKAAVAQYAKDITDEAQKSGEFDKMMEKAKEKSKAEKLPSEIFMLAEVNEFILAKVKKKIEGKTVKKAFDLK